MKYIIEWEIGDERRYTVEGSYVSQNINDARRLTLEQCLNIVKYIYNELKTEDVSAPNGFRLIKV